MTMRALGSILLLLGLTQAAQADVCDPLKPRPPANTSLEVVGKIDAKLDGLAKRFLNLGTNLEGSYKEMSTDVLKEYPNADRVYMWGETLYLFCVTVTAAKISDSEKLDRIQALMILSQRPPPP